MQLLGPVPDSAHGTGVDTDTTDTGARHTANAAPEHWKDVASLEAASPAAAPLDGTDGAPTLPD